MAYMTDPGRADQTPHLNDDSPISPGSAPVMAYRIKRVGGRPLTFRGVELAMAMSFSPDLPYWYEINLFRTIENSVVLCVKQFFQAESEQDQCRAWTLPSLNEAFDKLEAYDAADDVRIGLKDMNANMSAAELFAHAMDLRARTDYARRHFKGLVGEFFSELEEA